MPTIHLSFRTLMLGLTSQIIAVAVQTEAFTQTLTTALGQIIIACITGYCLFKVSQLKSHINSRMDQLLDLTRSEGRVEGRSEGRAEGRAEGRSEGRSEVGMVLSEKELQLIANRVAGIIITRTKK